jgi:hypothetical protein
MLVKSSQYPAKLAEAGFFFEPVPDGRDRCVCFACGLELVNWNSSDNPVMEHLKYTDSSRSDQRPCRFIELIKRHNPTLLTLGKETKFTLSNEALLGVEAENVAVTMVVKAKHNLRRDFLKSLLVSTMFNPALQCPQLAPQ